MPRTKVEEYVEAVRTVAALEQAQKDDGPNADRERNLKLARAEVLAVRRRLRGGELGKATRILADRPEPAPPAVKHVHVYRRMATLPDTHRGCACGVFGVVSILRAKGLLKEDAQTAGPVVKPARRRRPVDDDGPPELRKLLSF